MTLTIHDDYADRPALVPGQDIPGWCSACNRTTDHRWQPGTKTPLKCQRCEKESEK